MLIVVDVLCGGWWERWYGFLKTALETQAYNPVEVWIAHPVLVGSRYLLCRFTASPMMVGSAEDLWPLRQ